MARVTHALPCPPVPMKTEEPLVCRQVVESLALVI